MKKERNRYRVPRGAQDIYDLKLSPFFFYMLSLLFLGEIYREDVAVSTDMALRLWETRVAISRIDLQKHRRRYGGVGIVL